MTPRNMSGGQGGKVGNTLTSLLSNAGFDSLSNMKWKSY